MLDKYQEEYEKIEVPSKLKTETLLKMKEEEEKKSIFSLKRIFLSLCAIIIAFSVYVNFASNGSETPFEEGKVLTKVEIEEGTLTFEKQEEKSFFGNMDNEVLKTISKAEAETLSNDIFVPISMTGFDLIKKEYFAYYEKETFIKVAWTYTYQYQDTEVVLSYFSKSDEIETNSKIENKKVAIFYDSEEDAIFDAYFKQGEGVIEVSASDMTQEEFTSILVKIVKKVK